MDEQDEEWASFRLNKKGAFVRRNQCFKVGHYNATCKPTVKEISDIYIRLQLKLKNLKVREQARAHATQNISKPKFVTL